jgi:hypothetical protein
MRDAILDVERVRPFLRGLCDPGIPLENLSVDRVTVDAEGPRRVLYEAAAPSGRGALIAAERLAPREAAAGAPPAAHAPELGFVFHIFPADPSLPTLAMAADGVAMSPILDAALGPHVCGVDVEAVRYKPGRQCVLRYGVTWVGAQKATVYGKVAERPRFERAREALGRLGAVAGGLRFRLPASLGAVPSLRLELFAPMHGLPLSDCSEAVDFLDLCARAGEALHDLHDLPVALASERDLHTQLTRLAEAAVTLTWFLPACAARVETLRDALRTGLAAVAPARRRPIHGDFHMDNVLVSGSSLGLMDLEDATMGDPADDVGWAWAQLTWLAIKTRGRTPALQAGRQALLSAYLARSDAETAARVPLYAALGSFLFAARCLCHFRRRARHTQAEALLAVCEGLLEQGPPAVAVLSEAP